VNLLIASAALGLAAVAAGPQTQPSRECRVVHGRYAVYADGDALWIVGSRHRLSVVIAALDRELEARGWQDTVVFGDFTLCAARIGDPWTLTIRDRVDVAAYANLSYRHRQPPMRVR